MSTNKTLADVQPGGRVRLGDGLLQKAYDDLRYYVDASPCELAQRGISREDALDIARESEAALSAQPSPGGQGDAMPPLPPKDVVDTHLPTGVRIYGYTAEQMQGYARAALAARQPVGQEPVSKSVGIDALVQLLADDAEECAKGWVERGDAYASGKSAGLLAAADYFRKIATSQRWSEFLSSPAQAVDLGAVRDIARKAFSVALPGSEVDAELRKLLALIDKAVGNG